MSYRPHGPGPVLVSCGGVLIVCLLLLLGVLRAANNCVRQVPGAAGGHDAGQDARGRARAEGHDGEARPHDGLILTNDGRASPFPFCLVGQCHGATAVPEYSTSAGRPGTVRL